MMPGDWAWSLQTVLIIITLIFSALFIYKKVQVRDYGLKTLWYIPLGVFLAVVSFEMIIPQAAPEFFRIWYIVTPAYAAMFAGFWVLFYHLPFWVVIPISWVWGPLFKLVIINSPIVWGFLDSVGLPQLVFGVGMDYIRKMVLPMVVVLLILARGKPWRK